MLRRTILSCGVPTVRSEHKLVTEAFQSWPYAVAASRAAFSTVKQIDVATSSSTSGSGLVHAPSRLAILGADESGYSSIAGPVIAAACWMSADIKAKCEGILRDSKTMNAVEREAAHDWLVRLPRHQCVAEVVALPPDALNEEVSPFAVKQNALSMAIRNLTKKMMMVPELSSSVTKSKLSSGGGGSQGNLAASSCLRHVAILVDGGDCVIPTDIAEQCRQRAPNCLFRTSAFLSVVKGESRSPSICAASVLAQHAFNAAMADLDERYPAYGFRNHRGHASKEHVAAIHRHGPLEGVHRWCNVEVRAAAAQRTKEPPLATLRKPRSSRVAATSTPRTAFARAPPPPPADQIALFDAILTGRDPSAAAVNRRQARYSA